jgi:GTP:adenosylcobinamide-phosphate guanylyltransferase
VTTYDAILPAGGEIDPAFAAEVGVKNKALIEIGGKTVLQRVMQALRDSGRIRRIAVIGPDQVHQAAEGADLLLQPGSSGPDNILKGLAALQEGSSPPTKVLVVTTDLPFLTPEIINRFIDSCPPGADICVPLIDKDAYVTRFPNSTATFVPLRDGVLTAGCMYLFDVAALQAARPHMERIFEVRKSKIGMARLLGPKFLVKFLTKSLTVEDVEKKITGLLHCTGKAIQNSAPELAYDIDYLDDYEYAVQHVK